MSNKKVAVVTVTYGDRWKFLSQVISAVMSDDNVTKLIIVDNGSKNHEEILHGVEKWGDRVTIIRHEKNLGSAGGFARGIEVARTIDCDFVLMLDDDNVPEINAVSMLIARYEYIDSKCVICAFRPDIQTGAIFSFPPTNPTHQKTFFDVWELQKARKFFGKVIGFKEPLELNRHYPIIPIYGFVYGGVLLPIEAVREAPLPDADLVLYGDDVEYSWGVIAAGYTPYLCDRPIIRDVDMSFEAGDHILGLFNKKTQPFKVYFRIRNMVRISKRNTTQSKFVLHSSVAIWILGLFIVGVSKYGITLYMVRRMKLILQAVYGGYTTHAQVPLIAQLP